MRKLEDFIARSERFQGQVIQKLDDMEKQRTEDRSAQEKRCNNHGERLVILEKAHWKVAGASGLLGFASGLFAALWGGKH
jgi:hypothetical protein